MTNKKARASSGPAGTSSSGVGTKRKRTRKGRTAAAAEASSSSSSSSSSDDSSDDEQMAAPPPTVHGAQVETESSSDDSSSSGSSSNSSSAGRPIAARDSKGKGKARMENNDGSTVPEASLKPSRYSPEPESDEYEEESDDSELDPYTRAAKKDMPRLVERVPLPASYIIPRPEREQTPGERLWHERRRREKEERRKQEEEDAKIDQELDRQAFEKMWMKTVTEEFKDELLEINKREPGLSSDPPRLGMLINSLAYLGKRDDEDIAFLLHGKYKPKQNGP